MGQIDTRLRDIPFILIIIKSNNFKQIDIMVSNKQIKNVSVIVMNLFPINCGVDVSFFSSLVTKTISSLQSYFRRDSITDRSPSYEIPN